MLHFVTLPSFNLITLTNVDIKGILWGAQPVSRPMASNFLTQIFGSRNDRQLKQYKKVIVKINALEPSLETLSDELLKAKTQEFKDRVAQGESLEAILPEAFAVVREGSKRIMKMRHFDVQMLGGMSLHYGKISEMGTGEGKTLTATLPVYLNALSGKGVHVVTVNDYLANRDARWMGRQDFRGRLGPCPAGGDGVADR